MEKILGQDAIDALFFVPPASEAGNAMAGAAATEPYNFGSASQISSEQMRAISLVNEQFVRNLMHTLGAWLRTQTHIVLAAAEQMPYVEFLSRIPEPNYLCLLRMEPLDSVGLLELDLTLALTMIELLLGGHGLCGEVREVTEIEDAILVAVIEIVVRELNNTWGSVGLRFSYEKRDNQSQIPRLMAGGERTLCVSLELQMLGVRGMLNLCLPAVVLNTIHRRLISMQEKPRRKFEGSRARVNELMNQAQLRVAMRLPQFCLPAAKIQNLAMGDVLEIPLSQETLSELLVDGVVVNKAIVVRRGEHVGALLHGNDFSAINIDASSFAMDIASEAVAA